MHLCEQCGQRPAVVEFIQVIGDVRKRTRLCRECAVEQSLEGSIDALRAFAQQIFGELFAQAKKQETHFAIPEKPCPSCGTTFQQFLESSIWNEKTPDHTKYKQYVSDVGWPCTGVMVH